MQAVTESKHDEDSAVVVLGVYSPTLNVSRLSPLNDSDYYDIYFCILFLKDLGRIVMR